MKTNKGFTLAEMVAVIAILMFLAMLSTPFVKGYIDDAYNGKAMIFMRQLNEARMNFEKDYPGAGINGELNPEEISSECNVEGTLNPGILISCRYLVRATDLEDRYTFKLGSSADCSACTASAPVISMVGTDNAGVYKNKCACMDSLGKVYKQE